MPPGVQHKATAGYYLAVSWAEFTDAGEVYVCDACMWADPRYILIYGRYIPTAPRTVAVAPPESVLLEAERLTTGARRGDYGHPLDDYTRTAELVSAVFRHKLLPGVSLTAEDMIRAMICVKLSRDVNLPKRDNRTDGAGYFGCLQMVTEERERREIVAKTPQSGTVRLSDLKGEVWV